MKVFSDMVGAVDGVNTIFEIGGPFVPGSISVVVNGIFLSEGFTETATGVELSQAPTTGGSVQASYDIEDPTH